MQSTSLPMLALPPNLQKSMQQPTTAILPAPATNSCSRLRWEPITIVHEDGTVVHTFLTSHEKWIDVMLLRALIVEQAFFDAP
jgi:hypothetical protein